MMPKGPRGPGFEGSSEGPRLISIFLPEVYLTNMQLSEEPHWPKVVFQT